MPGRKSYAGGAARTTLNGGISNSDTTIVVTSGTGYPTGGTYPFVITIDRGTASEEKVLVQSRSGTTLTVAVSGRGYDGTTAVSHADAAYVEHTLDADSIAEANLHVNDDTRDDHSQYLNTTRHDVTARHGSGVVDHGSIGGLSDNDHPQYLLAADFTKAAVDALAINAATLDTLDSTAFSLAAHTHSYTTALSVAELLEEDDLVDINTAATTIDTVSISLPVGWTTMAALLSGYCSVETANTDEEELLRGQVWIDSPTAGTNINPYAAQFALSNIGAQSLTVRDSVPVNALFPSLSATTNALLRANLTRGSNGEAKAGERYLSVVKFRLS